MSEEFRISAKNLGDLARNDFCPRCFWLKAKLAFRLPYQIFPGIFSSIDAYTKKVLHGYFDINGNAADWLQQALIEKGLPVPVGYINPPSYHKFNYVDPGTNIKLTGAADAILVLDNGSKMIMDYKTARFDPKKADSLAPIYEVQLNGYASIAANCELSKELAPVSHLSLLYMDPTTSDEEAIASHNLREDGFALGFTAHALPVELRPELIQELLGKAREIFDAESPPNHNPKCKECPKLDSILGLYEI